MHAAFKNIQIKSRFIHHHWFIERFSLDCRKTKTKSKYTSQPKGVVKPKPKPKPKPIPFDSQVKTALSHTVLAFSRWNYGAFLHDVTTAILGWFSNRTGTSLDDVKARGKDYTRLPVPNLPLCHWSGQLFDLRAPSSTDVPVLLLNQPKRLWLEWILQSQIVIVTQNTW